MEDDISVSQASSLSESSGRFTIPMNPITHQLARVSYDDIDLERDKENLIVVPFAHTKSTVEILLEDISSMKEEMKYIKEKLKDAEKDNSKNSYYIGLMKIVKVWVRMNYKKKTSNENFNAFNRFYADFIVPPPKEAPINSEMKTQLGITPSDFESIQALNKSRNIHAHGEKECFDDMTSENPNRIKMAFEELEMGMESAENYRDKDPNTINLVKKFLNGIEKEILEQNLLKN